MARDRRLAGGPSVPGGARQRGPRERLRFAVGRVEHEFRPVDHGVDQPQIGRDAVDDLRQRVAS